MGKLTHDDAERELCITFTITRSKEEYHAAAMLLGMEYSDYHHLFLPDTEDYCVDPDTMARLPGDSWHYKERCDMVRRMKDEREAANQKRA